MIGWKATLMKAIFQDDEFSDNWTDHKIVHARTEEGARAEIEAELEPEVTIQLGDIKIMSSKQYLWNLHRMGYVNYRTMVEYYEDPKDD
ncbi:MAG: hypothetical protein JRE40_00170 [Deltaproteobacteria bacterium]|nr:hypothetical protein [Deltaproteobacteria bacterium]